MSRGTILAHKHTLCEAYAGFFRALATERFSEVRNWLHPELEQLVLRQCERLGEGAFLRNMRRGLGTATQRLRLGSSVPEGARRIRTELVGASGAQAGTVCFVLSQDGWRIYSVEVWTSGTRSSRPRAPVQVAAPRNRNAAPPIVEKKKRSKLPKMLANRWFKTSF